MKLKLEAADVLFISAPLTRATCGRIGAAELGRMKEGAATLGQPARGEIVQERPLYDHLSGTRALPPASMPWVDLTGTSRRVPHLSTVYFKSFGEPAVDERVKPRRRPFDLIGAKAGPGR